MTHRSPAQWMIEPLRKYATFTGRARRAEFWWFWLLGVGITIGVTTIDFALKMRAPGTLVSLVLLSPNIAVNVRRLHDLDRSGWWLLIPTALGVIGAVTLVFSAFALIFNDTGSAEATADALALLAIPAVAVAVNIGFLVWLCQRGTRGDNRFGPDPLV